MTREEKAMYIAEKQGWSYDDTSEIWYTEGWKDTNITEWLHFYYNTFNGLMPIVVEINMATTYMINISFHYVTITNCGEFHNDYKYSSESELIDALQNAIIKYYEDNNE